MDEKFRLWLVGTFIVLGGNASNIANTFNPAIYRPDPFTGLQGAQLEARLKNDLYKVEKQIDILKYQLDDCRKHHK